MRYREVNTDLRWQRNALLVIAVGLVLLQAWALYGWTVASRELPALHIPPDVSEGVVVRPGEVPRPNVYSFALYVWQQINRWQGNGQNDYAESIYRFSAYLTPRFRELLLADMRRRGLTGELDERVRGVQEIPGHHYAFNRVDAIGDGVWVVWLDLAVEEHYRRTLVKQAFIRYPLRVVRMDIDKARNPFGLAIDGYAGEGPRPLRDDELHGAEQSS